MKKKLLCIAGELFVLVYPRVKLRNVASIPNICHKTIYDQKHIIYCHYYNTAVVDQG